MIAVGTVHPGHVTGAYHDSMCRLVARRPILRLTMRSAANVSRMRNEIVRAFLGSDATHLLTVDADIAFGIGDIDALLADDAPIVSALIYGLHEDGERFPVGTMWDGGGLRRMSEDDLSDGLTLVASVGAGFTLIQRRVLEDLEASRPTGRILWPYAETDEHGYVTSEDTTLCLRAHERGFGSFIDPRVRVRHVKETVV